MKRQGAAPPPCLSGSAPLGKVPPHLTPRALLIRARPVPLPHPETADAKRTFGLWDKWPDAIPTATCLLRCRSGRRSGFPARRACRAEGSFAAEPDHERPRGRGSKKTVTETQTVTEDSQHGCSVVNGAGSCQSCGFCRQWRDLPMDMFRAGNARFTHGNSRYISKHFKYSHFVSGLCQDRG